MASPAKDKKVVDVTAEQENWRGAIKRELTISREFESNWGYLRASQEELDQTKRPHDLRKTKYFGIGGSTSIKDKRIPLSHEEVKGVDPKLLETVKPVVTGTFTQKKFGRLETTSNMYGARQSLEIFGTHQYGVKGTISKTPTIY
jgi:hypothetical protein